MQDGFIRNVCLERDSCDRDSVAERQNVFPFFAWLLVFVPPGGNQGRTIVQDQSGIDFLPDEGRVRRMKADHTANVLKLSERGFDFPYADILEMPINLWQNPVPGVTPDTGNNYRHLFQSAQALYNILIVSIFESDIILKDRIITIA